MKSNGFYILGIEGGGTKTTWALIDEAGHSVQEGKAGPGNLQHLSETQLHALLKAIRNGIGEAQNKQIRGIGAAFAGCHLPVEKARLEKDLQMLWPQAEKVKAGEDTRSAFAGAHGQGEGIIVIAGTGANVQGHKDGRWEKAGGWGYLFSDAGSGYDIARRGLEVVYSHFDRTQEVTELGLRYLRHAGQNTLAELVPWVLARSSKTEIADLVPCVFQAAEAGDRLAQKLIKERAEALADSVEYIAHRLGLKKPNIGTVGSLLEKEAGYFAMFERAVRKRITAGEIFISRTPGPVGAARMIGAFPKVTPVKKKVSAPAISYVSATTEGRNPRSRHLDQKNVAQLVALFVAEEKEVQAAMKKAQPQLTAAANHVAKALRAGHRIFYVGAGTSGRLGVLDASEMPPTFNVAPDLIQGIIAGGSEALLRSQEGAEDDAVAGAKTMVERGAGKGDVVIGITASGTAPFVRGALAEARRLGATTLFLTCNPHHEKVPGVAVTIVLATGPELITGSTRLKSGTATKLALNLLSSIGMIRSGRVKDNLMINVQPTNQKLRDRAKRIVMTLANVGEADALDRLEKAKWDVAKAVGK